MPIKVRNPQFIRQPIRPPRPRQDPQVRPSQDFDLLIRKPESPPTNGSVTFSAHAQARLEERNIQLGTPEIEQLTDAVNKVQQKGSRESLVLMKDLALVVNVKNRNVITALDGPNMREKVFTNIDSTIIVG